MNTIYIDINCDVGEGIIYEEKLFPYISSCNIACGGHTGDFDSMTSSVRLAKEHGVLVGAHPSYPDREHFGRISIELSKAQLLYSIKEQLHNFIAVLENEQQTLSHIKPHGALYNDIAKDRELARCFLEAISEFQPEVRIYVPYGSAIAEEARMQEYRIWYEAFGDRNYNDNLSLVSRKKPKALIEDPKEVLRHVKGIIRDKKVTTLSGAEIGIEADTICIHGDTPTALQILAYLSSELEKFDIYLKK